MSFIETKCRLCTEEIGTKSAGLHDTDADHLKYKQKLKILFEDLVLEEDDTTPFVLCLFCVEKIRKSFEFRKQCLDAYQFWCIQFGREQSKSIDLNFKIIPSVDNQFMRYEFVPTNPTKEPKKHIKMEETQTPATNEIKKEIEDPVPLVGNMKNKLSSLLKLSPLESKTKVESPDPAPILSLTLLRRKCTSKKKTSTVVATPEKTKSIKAEVVPENVIKPILSIDKLKQNLNKRINIATAVDVKTEPDDDDDMPLKTLKRKWNDINAAKNVTPKNAAPKNAAPKNAAPKNAAPKNAAPKNAAPKNAAPKNAAPKSVTAVAPLTSPLKLNIFSLKNKLGTALKIGEILTETQKKERRPRKHGFIVDVNEIIADKKNNIFYCKYCFKYFQNVAALRYHVLQHAKAKTKKMQTLQTVHKSEIPEKTAIKTSQCDICNNWFTNLQLHKIRAHYKKSNKKTEKHKK